VGVHTVLSFTFDFCPTAVPYTVGQFTPSAPSGWQVTGLRLLRFEHTPSSVMGGAKQPSIWSLLVGAGGIYVSFILLGLYQVRVRSPTRCVPPVAHGGCGQRETPNPNRDHHRFMLLVTR
jgi:hypothetical protein